MKKKLIIGLFFALLLIPSAQIVGSVKFNSAKVVFYDSSDFVPVYSQISYYETTIMRFIAEYENKSSSNVYNSTRKKNRL